MIRAFLKGRLAKSEGGIALATVIGLGAVMILLTTTAITFSLSGVVKARTDQDWNGAMAAAYAGIEEYQSRLSNDNTYQQYGNSASPFSSTSTLDPADGRTDESRLRPRSDGHVGDSSGRHRTGAARQFPL